MASSIDPRLSRDGAQEEDPSFHSQHRHLPPQHPSYQQQQGPGFQDVPQPNPGSLAQTNHQALYQSAPTTLGYSFPEGSLGPSVVPASNVLPPPSHNSSLPIAPVDVKTSPSNDGSEDEYEETPDNGHHENAGHQETAEHNGPGPSQDRPSQDPSSNPKKPRACDNCRKAKVGCSFPQEQPPCDRCARMKKDCVVSAPSRKRAKRSDQIPRIMELEKTVAELSKKLEDKERADNQISPAATRHEDPARLPGLGNRGGGWAPASDRSLMPPNSLGPQSLSPVSGSGPRSSPLVPGSVAGQKRKFQLTRDNAHEDIRETIEATSGPRPVDAAGPGGRNYRDIIDRGLITEEQADELFQQYTDSMAPHLPGVVFPEGTTCSLVRRDKPLLFLSIMAASSSDMPEVQHMLVKELMKVIAQKVVVIGEKTVELIQAIHVSVIWYWPGPQTHFGEMKFYTFVQIALAVALDLGLGKRMTARRVGLRRYLSKQGPKRNALPDPTTIESRRTWLTTYLLTISTSMALHRPHLVRWDSFLEECVKVLESSPEAAPTDRYLCRLVWTHRMAEDIGTRFAMHDEDAVFDITDLATQVALRDFKLRLDNFTTSLPEDMNKPSLLMAIHSLNVYLHESPMTAVHNEELEEGITEEAQYEAINRRVSMNFTSQNTEAIARCVQGAHGVIETFTSLPVERVRRLPVLNFVRVAYGVMVLLRIHRAASFPNSDLGKLFKPEDLRTEEYLDKLMDCYKAASAGDKCSAASRFLPVTQLWQSMLRNNFLDGAGNHLEHLGRQIGVDNQVAAVEYNQTGPNTGQLQPYQPQQGNYSAADTPLQALAEVASRDNDAIPGPSSSVLGRQQQPQPTPSRNGNGNYNWPSSGTPGFYNNTNVSMPGNSLAPVNDAGNTLANMNTPNNNNLEQEYWPVPDDWRYNMGLGTMGFMGDSFAQAMELTGLTASGMGGLGMMDPAGYDLMPPPPLYMPQQAGPPPPPPPSRRAGSAPGTGY